tara:strand:+ start:3990 stop:4238 length:249 start_codon:yes stop_codon:yes gene_type:complete
MRDNMNLDAAPISTAQVNRAILHTGLTMQHKRGSGYFYFTDTKTDEQIGESLMVCYLHQQTLRAWIVDAETVAQLEPGRPDI